MRSAVLNFRVSLFLFCFFMRARIVDAVVDGLCDVSLVVFAFFTSHTRRRLRLGSLLFDYDFFVDIRSTAEQIILFSLKYPFPHRIVGLEISCATLRKKYYIFL